MSDLIQMTLDPEVRNNPTKLGELIFQLADDIESCKEDLSTIKNRGWFDRMCSNNTRDLADAMIKQNDTISLFLSIVQSLIVLNLNNTVILAGIQDELTKQETGRGDFSNKYVAMAKDYLTQSITSAKKLIDKLDSHENRISTLKTELEQKEALDEEQSNLIHSLTSKYKEKEELDRKQSESIESVQVQLSAKSQLDTLQSSALEELKARVSACEQSLKLGSGGQGLGRLALIVAGVALGAALFALFR